MIPNTAILLLTLVFLTGLAVVFYISSTWNKNGGHRKLIDTFNIKPLEYSSRTIKRMVRENAIILGVNAIKQDTGKYTTKQWIFGKEKLFPLSEEVQNMHVMIIGATGMGKSRFLLATFISSFIQQTDANSLIIFDPQRDMTEKIIALCEEHHRPYIILPDDGYNPLGGEGTAKHRSRIFADVFVQYLAKQQGSGGEFYAKQAAMFLRHAIPLHEEAMGEVMILAELQEFAISKTYREMIFHRAKEKNSYGEYVSHLGDWNDREYKENLAELREFIDMLLQGDREVRFAQRDAPSIAQLVEKNGVIIIREGGTKPQDRAPGLVFAIEVQEYIDSRNGGHPLKVIMDEFPLYLNAGFPHTNATCRKNNVSLVVCLQTLDQLGAYETEVTTNCRTLIMFGGGQPKDTMYVERVIGHRLHELKSTSQHKETGAKSEQETRSTTYEPLLMSYEVHGLPAGHVVCITPEFGAMHAYRVLKVPNPPVFHTHPYIPKPREMEAEEIEPEEDPLGKLSQSVESHLATALYATPQEPQYELEEL